MGERAVVVFTDGKRCGPVLWTHHSGEIVYLKLKKAWSVLHRISDPEVQSRQFIIETCDLNMPFDEWGAEYGGSSFYVKRREYSCNPKKWDSKYGVDHGIFIVNVQAETFAWYSDETAIPEEYASFDEFYKAFRERLFPEEEFNGLGFRV